MKKVISMALVFMTLISISIFPTRALGIADEKIIEEVTGIYDTGEIQPMAVNLISSKSLSLTKTSSGLVITATTVGIVDVTKCGFTYIKLQRLINGKWTDYTTYCYTDLYNNSNSKSFSKTATPSKGYTYRVICEHYAEKKKLLILKDKETSYNVTSSLAY